MKPMVRCWIVLREYDYEGKEVVAVFSAETAANEFCEKQERTVISRCVVEEWEIQRKPNARPHADAVADSVQADVRREVEHG